jgi:hypothetical protein
MRTTFSTVNPDPFKVIAILSFRYPVVDKNDDEL